MAPKNKFYVPIYLLSLRESMILQPFPYQGNALPIVLRRRVYLMDTEGYDPPTFWM